MGFVSHIAQDYSAEYEIAKAIMKAKNPVENRYYSGRLSNSYVRHPQYKPFSSSYRKQNDYSHQLEGSRRDFTRNIPSKILHEFPNSGNEGLYGFTYLGHMAVNRNERLRGTAKGYETDVHECIHTDWEYETRVLTKWMMEGCEEKYRVN